MKQESLIQSVAALSLSDDGSSSSPQYRGLGANDPWITDRKKAYKFKRDLRLSELKGIAAKSGRKCAHPSRAPRPEFVGTLFPKPTQSSVFLTSDTSSIVEGFKKLEGANCFGFSTRKCVLRVENGRTRYSMQLILLSGIQVDTPHVHAAESDRACEDMLALSGWTGIAPRREKLPLTVAFDLQALDKSGDVFSSKFGAIFSSPSNLIVGINIISDLHDLSREFGKYCPCFANQIYAALALDEVLYERKARMTLRQVTLLFTGFRLPKKKEVGDWSVRPLSWNQIQDASYDAPASILAYYFGGSRSFQLSCWKRTFGQKSVVHCPVCRMLSLDHENCSETCRSINGFDKMIVKCMPVFSTEVQALEMQSEINK